ncbi:unnamed protein product [Closterium sp. NIES-53]
MDAVYSITHGSLGLRVPSLGPLPVASVGTCAFSVGACVVTSPTVTTAVALLSFTLDSGASQCFFRDHTTVTPLLAPVPLALADPTSGLAVARSSTTLPCPAVPSGFLIGLYIPSFSRNLVGAGYLQDRGIRVTFPTHGRTAICTDSSTGAVLATFTREPHSGLFVLHTSPPQVAVSSLVATSCSCRSLAHPTVLWHHCLGHPSLPRLRSMASHSPVSGLPCVFPSLPCSLAPPCAPCGSGRERYFLVVVDDYSRYTTVFPLAKKSEVTATLIRWLLATEGIRCSRISCLHSDRGGEFRSGILAGYPCRGLPVPPPPLFLAPSPPPALTPQVPPPHPGPTPSGVSHATPLPSIARQVASPSPQSSSQSPQQPSALPRQVTVDSGGVGAGGAAAGGTQAEGARLRGVGAGVAGTGGASSGGVGAGGTGTEGASSGGVGAGSAGTRGASSGGVGAGGAGSRGASSGGVGGGGICQRELCVGPRPRLGGANFVVGCTGGTANLQQWATPTWASWSTGLVDLHGATAMPPTWEAGG